MFHKAFHLVTYAQPYHVTACVVKPRAAAAMRRETVVNFVFPGVQGTATNPCVSVTWVRLVRGPR